MDIQWIEGVPNFDSRNGVKPFIIVDHISAGTLESMTNWFKNPLAQASSNFGIGRDGTIVQYVKIEDRAWCQGIALESIKLATAQVVKDMNCNPNYYCVSIEHEGHDDEGGDGTLTDAQFAASCWLHRYIMNYLNDAYAVNMGLGGYNVIGHFQIDTVHKPNCPGPNFPWTKLRAELAIAQTMTLQQYEMRQQAAADPKKNRYYIYKAYHQHNYLYNQYNADPVKNAWLEPYLMKMHEITKDMGMYFGETIEPPAT